MNVDGLTLIVGSRGSGKTSLLHTWERAYREGGGLSVVWDPLGQWSPAPGRVVVRRRHGQDVQSAALEAIRQAPATLWVDEITTAWRPRQEIDAASPLGELIFCGRQAAADGPYVRRGPVAMVAAAQRPKRVPTDLRAQLNVLVVGRIMPSARQDLEWIDEATGSDEVSRWAASLPELEPGKPAPFRIVRL